MTLKKYNVDSKFEQAYLAVRETESRVYTLPEIRLLPETDAADPNAAEWKRRAKSCARFLAYAKIQAPFSCLDLGCGNGWMMNRLRPFCSNITGVDVNQYELEQATALFESDSAVDLIYGDIFEIPIEQKYDCVLIYAAVQYFPDFAALMQRLATLLKSEGSIHIMDSPFYQAKEVAAAKQRTVDYYQEKGKPEMAVFYHHHSWEQLNAFKPKLHYDPKSLKAKLKNKLSPDSPFPWIEIRRSAIV